MPPVGMFYDRAGRAISKKRFDALFADDAYRQIAHTEIERNVSVLTVWVGTDPTHHPMVNRPLVFETAVIVGLTSIERHRSSTEDAALAMHGAIDNSYRAARATGFVERSVLIPSG